MPDGALHTLSQPQACAFIAQYESCYTPEHTRAWVSDTLPTLRNCIEVSLQNVKLYSLESMAHGGHYSELGRKVLTFLSFMATQVPSLPLHPSRSIRAHKAQTLRGIQRLAQYVVQWGRYIAQGHAIAAGREEELLEPSLQSRFSINLYTSLIALELVEDMPVIQYLPVAPAQPAVAPPAAQLAAPLINLLAVIMYIRHSRVCVPSQNHQFCASFPASLPRCRCNDSVSAVLCRFAHAVENSRQYKTLRLFIRTNTHCIEHYRQLVRGASETRLLSSLKRVGF